MTQLQDSTREGRMSHRRYTEESSFIASTVAAILVLVSLLTMCVVSYALRMSLGTVAFCGSMTCAATALFAARQFLRRQEAPKGVASVGSLGFSLVSLLGVELPGNFSSTDAKQDVLLRYHFYQSSEADLRKASVLFAFTTVVIFIVMQLGINTKSSRARNQPARLTTQGEWVVYGFLALIGTALQLSTSRMQTFSDRGNVGASGFLGVFFWAIPMFGAATLFARGRSKFRTTIVIMGVVAILIFSGNRSPLLLLVSAGLVKMRNGVYRPLRLTAFAGAGYVLVILAAAISTWRANVARGTSNSIGSAIGDAAQNPIKAALASGLDTRAGFIFSERVLSVQPGARPLDPAKALISFIPRFIYPDKPIWLGNIVSQQFFGVSRGGIFLSELGYLVLVTGSVWGAVLGALVVAQLVGRLSLRWGDDPLVTTLLLYFSITFAMGGDAFNIFNTLVASLSLYLARSVSRSWSVKRLSKGRKFKAENGSRLLIASNPVTQTSSHGGLGDVGFRQPITPVAPAKGQAEAFDRVFATTPGHPHMIRSPLATNSAKRLLQSSAVLVSSRVIALMLGVVMAGLMTRGLTPAEYGVISVIITLDVLSNLLTDLGLSQLLIRDAANHELRDLVRTVAIWRTLLGTCAGVLALTVGLFLVSSTPERLCLIAVMASSPFAGLTVGLTVAQLKSNATLMALLILIQSSAQLAAVLLVYVLGLGLVFYGLALTIGGFGFGVACYLVLRSLDGHRGQYLPKVATPMLREGAVLGAGTVIIYAYHKVDAAVVFSALGPYISGFYSGAYRVLDQALIVPQAVVSLTLPALVVTRNQGLDWRATFMQQRRVILLAALGISIAIGCGAKPILVLALGSKYGEHSPQLLQILAPSLFFMTLTVVQLQLVVLLRKSRLQLLLAVAILVSNLVLLSVLIPKFHAEGAAMATVITEAAAAACFTILVIRFENVGFGRSEVFELAILGGGCVAGGALAAQVVPLGGAAAPLAIVGTYIAVVFMRGNVSKMRPVR